MKQLARDVVLFWGMGRQRGDQAEAGTAVSDEEPRRERTWEVNVMRTRLELGNSSRATQQDGHSHRGAKLLAANGEAFHTPTGRGRFSFSVGERKIMNHFVVW